MKSIIVYYSMDGNTKKAAESIAEKLNCDIIELKMVKPIPRDKSSKFMKGGMQAVFVMKPKLVPYSFNENEYDRIILGMPVWAGKPASPINTFLSKLKNKNKVIAVFTSSGGGDNDTCITALRKKLNNIKQIASLANPAIELSKNNEAVIDAFANSLEKDT